MDIRLPNINAPTEAGQLQQIRSYLYQFAEQLQWALNTIETGGSLTAGASASPASVSTGGQTETEKNFNQIKSLIIKSADIVNAYYEQINARIRGQYVAQSDFGTYTEETQQVLAANSTGINQLFENLQAITETVDGMYDAQIHTSAYIKSGLLYNSDNGTPVYGLEVGQTNTIDGVDTFDKFARFTSDRLSFYDRNDTEVAYISDYKLFISNAEVTGSLTLGGYKIDTSNGLAFKWIGR